MLHATSTLELLYRLRVLHRASLSSKKESTKVAIFLSLHYAAAELDKYKIRRADSIKENKEKYTPSYAVRTINRPK
jgi:hypothetical protein